MTPDAESLARLCAAAIPGERLTAGELRHVCSGPATAVLGDDEAAVAVTARDDLGVAWILLAVVHPAVQGRGRGHELVRAAAGWAAARGAHTLRLGDAVPRYLWPGVDVTNTRAGMLFESAGFENDTVAVNMAVPTTLRRDPPPGVVVEREHGDGALRLAARAYPHWVEELTVAVGRGTAFAARDAHGETVAFGCHSVNRAGWIGPMATDPARRHGGVGSAVLAAVCADLADRGHATGEIAWVSNLRFYGKCGATVSRVFRGAHLTLRAR